MLSLGRKALKSVELGIIGVIAAVLAFLGYNEIFILFGMGLIGVMIHKIKNPNGNFFLLLPVLLEAPRASLRIAQWHIFWVFLKIGAILYGSGYVLFAFLDAELVSKGLLSRQQLVDAIAVGQFTPGPVFSAATFIGWQMAGLPGAIVATIGIFLPSFLFVALLNPLLPRLRRSAAMSAFLDTINMVSVALILVVCWDMAKTAVSDWRTITIAILGFIVSVGFKKLNSAFVILGGALLGYCLTLV